MKKVGILFVTAISITMLNSCGSMKHMVTVDVPVNGDCDMCKVTIERVGSEKGEALVVWDTDKKMANIQYDTTKTSLDEILKRIAAAGYDSEQFKATEEAYESLPGCCQYDRNLLE